MIRSLFASMLVCCVSTLYFSSGFAYADDPVIGNLDFPTPDNAQFLPPGGEVTITVSVPAKQGGKLLDQTTVGFKFTDDDAEVLAAFGPNGTPFESVTRVGDPENPDKWIFTFKVQLPLLSSTRFFIVGTGQYEGTTISYGPFAVETGD